VNGSIGRATARAALAVTAPVVLVALLAGCGSTGSDSPTASAGARADSVAGDTGSAQSAGGLSPVAHSRQGQSAVKAVAPGTAGEPARVQERAVVSTGDIELVSDDLSATRVRIDDALTAVGGHVADENTDTDDHGTVRHIHLVLRVPSSRFGPAMGRLAATASLRASTRKAEDVTTQVIDLGARIAAERAGVRRLRQLVSGTADLRALLDVERALTERQGELQSLRQQRAYLADRTSLATITVDVSRKVVASPVESSTGGFVGGLRHGWHGLVDVVVALLVALGTVLPFLAAGALVGLPAWVLVRRVLRSRGVRAPAES
jgi:Domain of unknown function (DUF4349)